ncbi:MAG: hypothetical protein J6C38_02025 [Oscillospiraceae bacterium]|nr:hypothetical protein [Oscillospiraceae bacterium]
MELLKQNEIQANKVAANVMRITAIVFTVVYILDLVGVFTVDKGLMTTTFIIGTLILFVPTLLINVLKLNHPSLKYIIVLCAALFVTMIAVTLTFHAVAFYVFAIALAALYFSRKLTIFAAIITILGTAAGQMIAFYAQTTVDHNLTTLFRAVVFGIAPRTLVLVALTALFAMLSRRTASMVGSLMSAEQQNIMREKSLEVSKKLLETVSELDGISSASAESNRSIADESSEVMRGSDLNSTKLTAVEESMRSISENLSRLSEMSGQIAALAADSEKITTENDALISNAYSSMNEVCKSTDESREIIRSLSEQSNQIVGIAKVITDISMQTNILAINASIEAARAGERGKGFSVVAGEIRTLSEKTKTAAAEIGEIISSITSDIEKTVVSMQKNSELTLESMDFMEKIKASADRVSTSSSGISSHISEINTIIGAAAENGENVSDNLTEVSGTIRENSEAIHHVAAAIQENSAGVEMLGGMVKEISQMAAELETLTK